MGSSYAVDPLSRRPSSPPSTGPDRPLRPSHRPLRLRRRSNCPDSDRTLSICGHLQRDLRLLDHEHRDAESPLDPAARSEHRPLPDRRHPGNPGRPKRASSPGGDGGPLRVGLDRRGRGQPDPDNLYFLLGADGNRPRRDIRQPVSRRRRRKFRGRIFFRQPGFDFFFQDLVMRNRIHVRFHLPPTPSSRPSTARSRERRPASCF